MINVTNITSYIRFLYYQKYQAAAPEEVVASWSQIPDDELEVQLQALYEHWGLNEAEAKSYEQAFDRLREKETSVGNLFPPPPSPSSIAAQRAAAAQQQQPVYEQRGTTAYTSVAPTKSSGWKTIAIVAILILLAAGGILAYQLYQNQEENLSDMPVTTDTSMTAITPVPQPEPEPEPMVTELPLNDTDEINLEMMQQLLAAEDQQNLPEIMNHYAPYMERYWDISYPTSDQLEKRYQDSWQKIADGVNTLMATRKVAPNIYDADINFQYYDIKKDTTKSVSNTLRFVFNDNHQVTQVYKLK